MNLDEMLGIDLNNPSQRLARILAEEDAALVDALVGLRKASGKSQSEIARSMGVSQSAVARIESGERDPHLSTLRRYAHAVGAEVTHRAIQYVHERRVRTDGLSPLPTPVTEVIAQVQRQAAIHR